MKKTQSLTIAALLISLGIIIPMFMPKFIIPPVSYTLASHVPIFIAMTLSPSIAVLVALGTAFGFFMTTPFVIALRAFSHIVFAVWGAFYLQRNPKTLDSPKSFIAFNIIVGIIHVLAETLIVVPFYTQSLNNTGEILLIVGLGIGVGGFIHSLIDFTIAWFIIKRLTYRTEYDKL